MRTRRKGKHSTRKRILVVLFFCSIAGLLLPTSLTGRLMNLVQVLVPLQDVANRSADAVGSAVDALQKPAFSAAEAEQVVAENQALRHTVASYQSRIADLEQSVQNLTRVRNQGLRGKLIPACVVAPDALAWRESQLIDAGSLRGVHRGAAVISNHFAVNLGTENGIRSGQAVLAAELFVGTVDLAGTHTSRVKLVSDPTMHMPVLIAREESEAHWPVDERFWFVGAGGNHARIEDVDHRHINSGAIQIGDRVLTMPGDERLPVSMLIGTITGIEPDKHNPLLYILDVQLEFDANRLRRVYVLDPTGE